MPFSLFFFFFFSRFSLTFYVARQLLQAPALERDGHARGLVPVDLLELFLFWGKLRCFGGVFSKKSRLREKGKKKSAPRRPPRLPAFFIPVSFSALQCPFESQETNNTDVIFLSTVETRRMHAEKKENSRGNFGGERHRICSERTRLEA